MKENVEALRERVNKALVYEDKLEADIQALRDEMAKFDDDADRAIGSDLAARFPSKPKFVEDMRRIFDDKSVDVVTVADELRRQADQFIDLADLEQLGAGGD
mgnify:CR=1 FL=1